MLHRNGTFAPVLSVAVLFGACSEPALEWCDPAGAPTHRIPADLSRHASINETWRFDGNQDGHELLAPISATLNSETHELALSDLRLGEVVRISSDGQLISRWGPHGSGPGEVRIPIAIAWMDAQTLAVFDPVNQKTIVLREGSEAEDVAVDREFAGWLTSNPLMWMDLLPSGAILGMPAMPTRGPQERELAVIRWTPSNLSIDTLVSGLIPAVRPEGYTALTSPLWAIPVAAASGDTVFAVAGDIPEYRVRVIDGDGQTLYQICRPVDALPPAEAELAVSPDLPMSDNVRSAFAEVARPDEPARIGRLSFDVDGRLWVQRDRPSPVSSLDWNLGRAGATFDVYSATGEYLAELRAPDQVRILGSTGDLVLGLETGAFDVLSVVGYTVVWPK